MEKEELRENTTHGTVNFPLANYKWISNKQFVVNLHWHNETELIFFKEGSFTVTVNMKDYRITKPTFMFVNSSDIHSIISDGGCNESAIVFDLKMLSFEYFDAIQYKIIRPLIEKRIQFPLFILEDHPIWQNVKKLYEKIIREANQNNLSSYIKVKSYLYQLIACLYESDSFLNVDDLEENDTYKIENLKKVLTFIHKNYSQKISLDEVASLAGMNTQYFCRYFKRLIGKTLTEYINEIRIEKASECLIKTDEKIIDIAICCGYDNIGYFIKRFKEQKNVSPSRYRKEHSKDK